MHSANTIKAIIFDLDDTLVSTANGWQAAEEILFRELGGEYSAAIARSYKGCNARDVGRAIHKHLQPAHHTPEACGNRMRELLIETVRRQESRPMPGAAALLAASRLPLAIASGSPLEVITCHLEHLHWNHYFQVLVSSEDLPRGKPAPDVYLHTAERLGIAPEAILVFEDSVIGLQAAKAANMRCAVVPSLATVENDTAPPPGFEIADHCFPSLLDVDLGKLLQ